MSQSDKQLSRLSINALYGVAIFSSLLFGSAASLTSVQAKASLNVTTQTVQQTQGDLNNQITIGPANFETYFQRSAKASYDSQNGTVLLYPINNRYINDSGEFEYKGGVNDGPDNPALAGSVYLNKNLIDMANDFSLSGSIMIKPDTRRQAAANGTNITDEGKNSYQYGDGFSFAFRPANSAPVGVAGMGLGMTGIPHAFGVGIDLYYNKIEKDNKLWLADQPAPNIGFASTQDIPGIYNAVRYTIGDGVNITGNDLDWMTTFDSHNIHSLNFKDLTNNSDGTMPFTLTWHAKTNELSYQFTDASGNQYTGTKVFPDHPNLANFAIAGSGNAAQAEYRIKIDKIQYAAYGIVNAKYLSQDSDNDSAIEIPGVPEHQTTGSLGETATISSKLTDVVSPDATADEKQALADYYLWKVSGFPTDELKDYYNLPFSGNAAQLPFSDVTQNVQLYYRKKSELSLLVNYVDENGKKIADSQTIRGAFGSEQNLPIRSISGYTFDTSNPRTFKLGTLGPDGKTVTQLNLTYHKNQPSSSSSDTTPSIPAQPGSSSSSSIGSGSSSVQSNPPAKLPLPNYAAKKNAAVYAINPVYLYKHADFKKTQRLAGYVKKPRVYRPMFVVTGYARSSTGKLRYEVRDVNHLSKTAGKRGYITANWQYVRPVYYAKKHSIVTVINPRGVREYRNARLTGKSKLYKQGSVLRVKRIITHNLTTRFVLTNGRYITSNRKLVNMGRQKQVRAVTTKRAINRYRTVNLTHKNRHIAQGKRLRVRGYDYTSENNFRQRGLLRYRVAGGYITANSKYVRAFK